MPRVLILTFVKRQPAHLQCLAETISANPMSQRHRGYQQQPQPPQRPCEHTGIVGGSERGSRTRREIMGKSLDIYIVNVFDPRVPLAGNVEININTAW